MNSVLRYASVALVIGCSCWFVAFNSSAEEPVGWRNQGTGHFVAHRIPTKWSQEEGVLWKAKMPGPTFSSPIIIGEHVITTAEPSELICVDRSNGEIAWQRSHNYSDIFPPEKVQQIARNHESAREVQTKIEGVQKQLQDLQQSQPKSAESPEAKALNKQIEDLQKQYDSFTDYPPIPQDGVGNTTSTPVSDGQTVWAVFATGMVSSHQLSGERNWIKFIEKPAGRLTSSPLLLNGHLIVHLNHLMAIDAKTGKIAWKVESPSRNGSPVLATIGDQKLIVTPSGSVVRTTDGHVLVNELFSLAYSSPVAHDDVVYAVERGKAKAIRLALGADSSVTAETLWEARSAEEDQCSSPVVHDGLLYSVAGQGILDVVDAATGDRVYRKRLNLGEGRVDPSLVVAGKQLFISSNNGTTLVLEPGREYQELAKNPLEGFSSSAFVVDNQICIRTNDALYCIGQEDRVQ